jgi:hypothetical protein
LSDIKLALRLAESIHSEPSRISLDARRAMVTLTLQPIWEGLVQHRWTNDQLTELDSELARLDFLSDIYHAVRAECAANLKVIDYCRVTHNADIVPFGYEPEDHDFRTRLDSLYYHSFPEGWYYLGEVDYARVSVWSVFSAVDLRRRVAASEYYGVYTEDGRRFFGFASMKAPWFFYVPILFPDVKMRNYARVQTGVDCARIAIALERYHHVHGEYPETLDAVAPLYPGKIPHDVVNGQPLHYRRTVDGNFLLYSVGWNRTDDGGVPAKDNPFTSFVQPETGDWVWLFPTQ